MSIRDDQIIDSRLVIETPENVILTYPLAGPAIRMAAYLIDFAIRAALTFGGVVVLSFASGLWSEGVSTGLMLIMFFVINWGYYVFCEGFFQGKTPGKRVFSLRVIDEQGCPVSFWAAFLRNMIRSVDSIPMYGIGWISMLLGGQFRRLGDLAARTVVIEERLVALPREPLILERIQPLPRGEIGSFVPPSGTLALIEQFLGRRHVLTHQRGHEMAGVLARALAEKMNYTGDPKLVDQYPMAFLARVYVTCLRIRDEERATPPPTPARKVAVTA